ncbi:efflux RND transporter periplasmic adaptor subunit [soil metagenome]
MARMRNTAGAGMIASLAVLSLAACGGKPKAAAAVRLLTPVQVAFVSAPSGASVVEAAGSLRRLRESALSFRIPGVMTRLFVDEGDTVKAGQVIATLDAAGVDARLRSAAADLDRAKRDVDRFSPLVEKGAISREQLDNQKSSLASARAAYDSAAFDRRWATLRAPTSGVVLSRAAQAGEVMAAGQPIVTLADAGSPLVLRAPLTDRDVAKVRLGQAVAVRLDALPGQVLTARITRIGQRARAESGQVEVEATIAVAPGLRSGMLGTLRIEGAATPSTAGGYLRVPAEAVLEATGARASVLRLDSGLRVRRTPVGFGGFDGDDALVSGLAPGERVVTAGGGYVADGEKVSVVDPTSLGPTAAGAGK